MIEVRNGNQSPADFWDVARRKRKVRPMPEPKPSVLTIAPYVPGKRAAEGFAEPIKLSSNENPLGCSPRAEAAYVAAAGSLNLYPDPRATGLRNAIAAKYGLAPSRLIFGCGSDELFFLLCMAFIRPGDNVVQSRYGFSSYQIAAASCDAKVRYADENDLTVDVDAILACIDARTRIVFLANPGNPTGTWLPASEVRRLHAGVPEGAILVVDSAYADYVTDPAYEDGLALAAEAPNVLVTRTFSKLHGLAAVRVGWGYGDEGLIDAMDRIRPPFNAGVPAQVAAVAALADEAFQKASLDLVEQQRPLLAAALTGHGCKVYPSATNFVLARFPQAPGRTAAEAEAFLASQGIIVRGLGNYGLGDCLRITIGAPEQNAALVAALGRFFA
jgi:histidinol-phosphate aminotransferase